MPDILGNDQPKDKSATDKAKGRAREAAGALSGDEGAKEKGAKEQGKKGENPVGKLLGK